MKTYIIYNLDTGLPVAVGEQISSEAARAEVCQNNKVLGFYNLLAEEIKLENPHEC